MNLKKFRPIYWHFSPESDGVELLPTESKAEIDEAVMSGAIAFYLDDEKGLCAVYADAMPSHPPYLEMIAESLSESKRVILWGFDGTPLQAIDIDPHINQVGIDYLTSYVEAKSRID